MLNTARSPQEISPFPVVTESKPPPKKRIRPMQLTLAIRRAMKERATAGRKFSGMSQVEVAEKLGFSNSSKISKIEIGEEPIPFWLAIELAKLYDVSLDYLCGLSNHMERDFESLEYAKRIERLDSILTANNAFVVKTVLESTVASSDATIALQSISKIAMSCLEAYDRVKELNPNFDEETRGGARLDQNLSDLKSQSVRHLRYIDKQIQKLEELRKPPLPSYVENSYEAT
jgi:transcriptional regulator with XRE-family HTH domain